MERTLVCSRFCSTRGKAFLRSLSDRLSLSFSFDITTAAMIRMPKVSFFSPTPWRFFLTQVHFPTPCDDSIAERPSSCTPTVVSTISLRPPLKTLRSGLRRSNPVCWTPRNPSLLLSILLVFCAILFSLSLALHEMMYIDLSDKHSLSAHTHE